VISATFVALTDYNIEVGMSDNTGHSFFLAIRISDVASTKRRINIYGSVLIIQFFPI
jgi:hypothetical protein